MDSLKRLLGPQESGPSPEEVRRQQQAEKQKEARTLAAQQRLDAGRRGVGSLVNLSTGLVIPGDDS